MKAIAFFTLIALLLISHIVSAVVITSVPQTDVPEGVLFAFDDVSIPSSYNLQLSMEQPEKYSGNPVLPIGKGDEPDEWQMRYYGTVIRQDGKFKMWYIAASREGFITPPQGGPIDYSGWRFAYAESIDGMHWVKPNLGLTEFRGSRNNNLLQMPEGFRGYHALVIYEPEEPDASRRFKMMVLLRQSGALIIPKVENGVFVPMYSADGLRWRVADELLRENRNAISPNFHLVNGFEGAGLYKWNGMYYLSGQGGTKAAMPPYGRHVQIYHSPDLLNWSETVTMGFARQGGYRKPSISVEGRTPLDVEQTHEGASVWNRGNVLIGLTGFWHSATEWQNVTHDLGFLVSNDGIHFREPQPDYLFARVGEDNRDWDEAGLSQGQGFENVGDKTYIWYGQMDQREGTRTGRPWKRWGGVGLLMLDRDRFGSLSVRDPGKDGTLITCSVTAEHPVKIYANVAGLGPDARIRVELLDPAERQLDGYSGTHAAVLTHSGLRTPISWNGKNEIAASKQPFKIQLRIEGSLRNSVRFYALYLVG